MQMSINGKRVESRSGAVIQVVDPATEEVVGTVQAGTPEDVDIAVGAAKEAFPIWRDTPAAARARMLHEAAAKMREHFGDLVRQLTLEEGKPIPENEEEVEWALNPLDYYAELGRHIRGRVIPSPQAGQLSLVLKGPYGVVGCIVPWNYPILLMLWKVAPALAAGNPVVVKPSSRTPLTTLRMVELAFDQFPAGVTNVVVGRGREIGDALVSHRDVPVIAFTGSTAVGRHIAEATAGSMKTLHLELGGKAPFVIADDAPLDAAVEALAYPAVINAGQVCTST